MADFRLFWSEMGGYSGSLLHRLLAIYGDRKVLTKDEETSLICKIKDGDSSALATLIAHNIRLASFHVRRFQGSSVYNLDDMMSEAILGLIEAANSYEPGRNSRFATWARYRINGRLYQYSLAMKSSVSIKTNTTGISKAFKYLNELTDVELSTLSARDLALAVDVYPHVAQAALIMVRAGSCEFDPDSTPGASATQDESVFDAEIHGICDGMLGNLDTRSRFVLEEVIMKGRTLDDVAASMGICRTSVAYIKNKALNMLRKRFRLLGKELYGT